MDIITRPMETDDWPEMVEIFAQGIQTNMSTFEITCPSYEKWDSDFLSCCRLVAEEDCEIVAWAAIKPFSSRECYSGVAELSIYVENGHRDNGVGKALLTALVDEAVKSGFWSLQSRIFEENTRSIAVHEKCGFRKIGYFERPAKDRFSVWRNVVLMEYRIQSDIAGGCDCDLVKKRQ